MRFIFLANQFLERFLTFDELENSLSIVLVISERFIFERFVLRDELILIVVFEAPQYAFEYYVFSDSVTLGKTYVFSAVPRVR